MPEHVTLLRVEYKTLALYDNLIDARQLGRSIAGIGKVSNSIMHLIYHGEVTSDPRVHEIKTFASAPEKGSILLDLSAILISGQLPIYWPLLCSVSELALAKLWQAIVSHRAGRNDVTEKVIDLLTEQMTKYADFAAMVHRDHLMEKRWYQQHVDRITDVNRAALRDTAQPVGRSSGPLTLTPYHGGESAVIDEPIADALRAEEDLEVGDAEQFTVVLHGVDKTNGQRKVSLADETELPIKGRITDPALMIPGNIYTRSLDQGGQVNVTAKPLRKEGRLVSLYISDGRPLNAT